MTISVAHLVVERIAQNSSRMRLVPRYPTSFFGYFHKASVWNTNSLKVDAVVYTFIGLSGG